MENDVCLRIGKGCSSTNESMKFIINNGLIMVKIILILETMIAMVDTSSSMTDNCLPLYNAIGLGICVSEK